MDLKRLISIIIIIALVLNIALYAAFRYNEFIFWGIIIIGFLASIMLKKLRK